KRWMVMPLVEIKKINERLEAVEYFLKHSLAADELKKLIRQIGDLERLISKVSLEKVNPREMGQLKRSLNAIGPLQKIVGESDNATLKRISEQLNPSPALSDRI